jgi:nickel-dependent lactate racemase
LHKKHTPEQVTRLLGPVIPKRYKVLHHDPSASGVVDLGQTPYGVPVTIDKAVTGYDMIISVGVVEPHLYAGYSGGAKTVAIGLAGIDTVNATHSIDFLKKPSTCIGSLKGNRFQETLWHIVERLPPIFSVNTVNSQDGDALKIFCGPVKDVFEKSVAFAKDVYEVTTGEACDIAICGIGYPKDINLYQASRAMNYVLSVDSPVVRSAGALIIAAELKDGIGGSPAEKRFHDELKNMSSPQDFIEHISRAGCVAGEHRAYMVARALAGHRIMFVNKRKEDFMDGLPFKFYTSIDDALKAAEELTGKDAKICVIPHSLATIPRLV